MSIWSRRNVLGLLAAAPWVGAGAGAGAEIGATPHQPPRSLLLHAATMPPPFASHAKLLVAGPIDGRLAALARSFKSGFDSQLPPSQAVEIDQVGGADGVTAANQFEARIAPDGETSLLVSGAAALAWLVGDPRAQFDIGHWLPVTTGQVSGVVLVGQTNMPPSGMLRLAIEDSPAFALPAQLGLYLLGSKVNKLVPSGDAIQSLAKGEADLAFLRGSDVAARLDAAVAGSAAKATPLFGLGSLDDHSRLTPDVALPSIPTLPDLLMRQAMSVDPALLNAWRALAAASRLDTALLLPWLTPANVVAWWRAACSDMAASDMGPFTGQAARGVVGGPQWHTDPTGNFGLNAIITDTTTSLALHRWLANQPG